MDVQYEQLYAHSNTPAYKRWLFIIALSLLINIYIVFTLNSFLKFGEKKNHEIIPPLSMILESARDTLVPSENKPVPKETEIPVIREHPVQPGKTGPDRLRHPVRTVEIPETPIIPKVESSPENIQLNPQDLLKQTKANLDSEAETETLRTAKNRNKWSKSPSIVYGKTPDYLMRQGAGPFSERQGKLARYINIAMINKANEPLIKPLKFTIGPITCYTLLVTIGCGW